MDFHVLPHFRVDFFVLFFLVMDACLVAAADCFATAFFAPPALFLGFAVCLLGVDDLDLFRVPAPNARSQFSE